MEFQKVINLLDNTTPQPFKLITNSVEFGKQVKMSNLKLQFKFMWLQWYIHIC